MEDSAPAARSEIVVYEAPEGPRVEVIVGDDTVWLSQAQMVDLFGRDQSVIARHIANAFTEGEVDRKSNMQTLHIASGGDRPTAFYNLDVIISVGYRVKSPRGTQFRRWATGVLRQHLIDGVTINQRRLEQRGREAERALNLALLTLEEHQLITGDGHAVLGVVQHYFKSWQLLRAYDEGVLSVPTDGTTEPFRSLTIADAREAIRTLADDMQAHGETPGLFGQERGDGLESILAQLEQTVMGEPAYPTVEERAAHLLYFVIKNHPLADGNKRVGSLLFLDYLRLNGVFLASDGRPRFSDTAIVALALLMAASDPKDKDLMINLVLTLLAEDRR